MRKKIGYLGGQPVTFSFQATKRFGDLYDPVGFGTHGEIYDAVKNGEVHCGLLAVENQLAGIVDETLHAVVQPVLPTEGSQMLEDSDTHVRIVREITVPVELFLLNQTGKLADIRVVKSHPIPLRQCKESLDVLRNNFTFTREGCASTDAAAQDAAENSDVAAISSRLAPSVYRKLEVVRRIDDSVPGGEYTNVTRFWMIERQEKRSVVFDAEALAKEEEAHKICLLFNLGRDHAGGLARSLEVFAEDEINLANIYPLPRRDRSWEYTFVVEFEVQPDGAEAVEHALKQLRGLADYTLMGVYPRE